MRRTLVLLAALAMLPLFAVPSEAAAEYRATITRTSYGIPHVVATDFGSLGFGHGYATAETSLCNLADTVLTARGLRSRYLGPDGRYDDHVTLSATNLEVDVLVRDLRNRKVVERLLADPVRGPSARARAMVRGYVAGVNRYVSAVGGSSGVPDPTCRGAAWIQPDATELDLWYGVYLANLLASTGVFVPEIAGADPPTLEDPGLPGGAVKGTFGARTGRNGALKGTPPSRAELLRRLGRETPFGSNATAAGAEVTSTGRGMVLGNPHFPWRGRYRFGQVQLTIPGSYNVAGAGLVGAPVVNIGWNSRVAWSHTVSTAFRFTPYEYRLVPGAPTTYLTESGPRELERRTVDVPVKGPDGQVHTVTEDVYRTPQGYVLDAPDALMGWTPASVFALRDANAEHLRTIDVFLDMAQATSVRDLLARQDRAAGMPWVNTIAADSRGDVLYADHSVVPNVPDDLVQQCLTPVGAVLKQLAGLPALDGTRAESSCAWRTDSDSARPGVFGPANLPATVRRDWVINANDSYWLPNPEQRLEGYAEIIGCERCERTLRTRMVYRYVLDRLAGSDDLASHREVSPGTLRLFQHTNRVFGAEVARAGDDLNEVCRAASGGSACDVLANWDGRSDTSSVGTHLFQEFWRRVPDQLLWEVPFDPADPVGTPRDLNEKNPQVVQAMKDALAYLHERGVPDDASWGRLQVAGDEGAPPIPIGGGEGFAGNANAVASRLPAANTDRLSPVSYGSSHIQAVAFTDSGVRASTILTYGQATDPTSPHSADQTRLFSREQWVAFPYTSTEIADDSVRRYTVTG